jgi:hypothetical protein
MHPFLGISLWLFNKRTHNVSMSSITSRASCLASALDTLVGTTRAEIEDGMHFERTHCSSGPCMVAGYSAVTWDENLESAECPLRCRTNTTSALVNNAYAIVREN